MKEPKYYICEFCQNEFTPTRRKVQKYCSDTCRSKAYYHRNKNNEQLKSQTDFLQKVSNGLEGKNVKQSITKVEQVSLAGMGNSALGTWAADGLKSLVTKYEDKPLTKGDIRKIAAEINGRYHLVKNANPLPNGKKAYFDMQTNTVVYL